MRSNFTLPTILVFLSSMVQAHTWIEESYLIGANGSFVGPAGFPRGYVHGADDIMTHRLTGPAFTAADPMCSPSQATSLIYNAGFPPIAAAPGDFIALRHRENGHVTLLTTPRPANSGTVFVYGTTNPSPNEKFLDIHRVWNAAGTGGDKRGKLLSTSTLDDGRCFQYNTDAISTERRKKFGWPGNNRDDNVCQTDVQIPLDAPTSGNYTLYWIWEWPLMDKVTGKVSNQESYTQCLDVSMTAKSTVGKVVFSPDQQMKGLNINNIAIPEQLANQFLVDPSAQPALTAGPPFTMSALPAATKGPAPAVVASTPVASPNPVTSAATTTKALTSSTSTLMTTINKPSGFVTVTVTESVQQVSYITVTKNPSATPAQPQVLQTPSSKLTPIVTPVAATTTSKASSIYIMPSGAPKVSPFLTARSFRVRGREVRL